jgi:hypothetical protein
MGVKIVAVCGLDSMKNIVDLEDIVTEILILELCLMLGICYAYSTLDSLLLILEFAVMYTGTSFSFLRF